MKTINIHEAKTHLSHHLNEAVKGESIIICKRNKPIAELRPILSKSMGKRPIGLAKEVFTVPASFFPRSQAPAWERIHTPIFFITTFFLSL
jgi:prevent-host-death family protein